MIAISGLFLAALALAQADEFFTGEVVDGQGKPVASAQVVLYAPPIGYGQGDPIELATQSDANGAFRLKRAGLRRYLAGGVNFLAYSPGGALTAKGLMRQPYRLVLEKPRPRPVKVEGADGRPGVGVRVCPCSFASSAILTQAFRHRWPDR